MAIRVWSKADELANGGAYTDYPLAAAFAVDPEHELDVLRSDGGIVATYAPGNWHHVEVRDDKQG